MAALIEALAIETGTNAFDLRRILMSAPVRYKTYEIRKRSGGTRVIAQPAREVKALQRALAAILLGRLPVHDAATAYRKGSSILANALPHAANGPLLKLDLQEFFPSIKERDWQRYCERTECLTDADEIMLTSRLLFRHDPAHRGLRLAIGAPTSPMLSNILMFEFDDLVAAAVAADNVTYTRYADDMTFSAPRTGYLTGIKYAVSKIIRKLKSPSLCLNEKKTTYVTMKYHRAVTGLTLANDGRVTIGRDRKRLISATVHHALMDKLSPAERQILAGTLAYVNAVEPSFLEVLRLKYGAAVIEQIQHFRRAHGRLPPHQPALALFDR